MEKKACVQGPVTLFMGLREGCYQRSILTPSLNISFFVMVLIKESMWKNRSGQLTPAWTREVTQSPTVSRN